MSPASHYLTQILHRTLREKPDAVATIDSGRQRTWRDLSERVCRFATVLHDLGLKPGDRVGWLASNSDRYLEFLFGTFWAGGVINPVNLRWTAGEMAFSLVDCETRILIVDAAFAPMVADIRAAAPCLDHVLALDGGLAGAIAYEAALDAAEPADEVLRSGDDLAAILYTGGTTGRSKGVMLSHRSLLGSAVGYAGTHDCAPGAVMLHTAPLFHIGGISGLLASLLRRSRHVFLPAFAPAEVMATIESEKVTDCFLVPTMMQAVLDHPDFASRDLSSLERIIYGAAPITPTLLARVAAALPGCGLVQAYGMTELSPVATLLTPEDHLFTGDDGQRLRSAGRATMTVEIRVVDLDDNEVPAGTAGEVVARGAGVMLGYWNLPEATAEALRGGWMHTGDIGQMDEHGYLTIVDRLKDMIVTGGENVYSAEVEQVLASHPAVCQCAVVGRPDAKWGETVHAVIVMRDGHDAGAEELAAHCRQAIAGYKIPRSFEFRQELPLSGAGKVLKKTLREEAI